MTDTRNSEAADSADSHPPEKPKKKPPVWREVLVLAATALVLTILIQTFIGRVFVIPSASMEHTLHGCPGCSNDSVFVDKVTFVFSAPRPGDVVVFSGPDGWRTPKTSADNVILSWIQDLVSVFGRADSNESDFVKRVIATQGQTVMCCDVQHRVVVDGKPLDEPYVYYQPETSAAENRPFGPIVVPPGNVWVMGDNRLNSADSRAHMTDSRHGTIPTSNIVGKVRAIVLPPARWQGVGDHNPQQQNFSAPAWQQGIPVGGGLAITLPIAWFRARKRLRV